MSETPSTRTALVVVDVQNCFCHPDGSFTGRGARTCRCVAGVPVCGRLVGAARVHGVRVIFTRFQYRGDYADGGIIFNETLGRMAQARALIADTWDAQIVDDLKPEPGQETIDKNRFRLSYRTQLAALEVIEYGFARIVDTVDETRAWIRDAVAVPGDAHSSPDFVRPRAGGRSANETA